MNLPRLGSRLVLAFLFSGLVLLWGCGADADADAAKIKDPKGNVRIRHSAGTTFSEAKADDPVAQGGAVRTGENGKTRLSFLDGSELTIKPESYFELNQGNFWGHQTEGAVLYKINKQKTGLTVETPHGVTSVLGTTFLIMVSSDSTFIGVEEGKVSFAPKGGGTPITIGAKQKISAPALGMIDGPQPFDLSTEEFNYIKIDGKWVRPQK